MYRGKMAALVCLFVCLLTIPVKAYNTNMEYEQPEIAPRMTYISDADCYFYIEDCVASVDAFVRGYPSTATKCEIVVELQEKSSLRWKTIETWSDEQEGRRAEVNESAEVTEGNSYRTVTTVTVWSGTDSETKTLTSKTINA